MILNPTPLYIIDSKGSDGQKTLSVKLSKTEPNKIGLIRVEHLLIKHGVTVIKELYACSSAKIAGPINGTKYNQKIFF